MPWTRGRRKERREVSLQCRTNQTSPFCGIVTFHLYQLRLLCSPEKLAVCVISADVCASVSLHTDIVCPEMLNMHCILLYRPLSCLYSREPYGALLLPTRESRRHCGIGGVRSTWKWTSIFHLLCPPCRYAVLACPVQTLGMF